MNELKMFGIKCPLVSIVMPCFNNAESLSKAIESVLSQSFENYELLIVDDCSTDHSFELMEQASLNDPRIKVLSTSKNSGAGVARNLGITHATGRFIAFLDADDFWHSDKLAKQIVIFDMQNVPLVCSGYKISRQGYEVIKTKIPKEKISYADLLKSNCIGCLTTIYDTQLTGKVYFPTLRKRQDYALWLHILKEHGHAFCVNEALATYNISNASLSSNKLEMVYWNYMMFRTYMNFSRYRAVHCVLMNIVYKFLNR